MPVLHIIVEKEKEKIARSMFCTTQLLTKNGAVKVRSFLSRSESNNVKKSLRGSSYGVTKK